MHHELSERVIGLALERDRSELRNANPVSLRAERSNPDRDCFAPLAMTLRADYALKGRAFRSVGKPRFRLRAAAFV
jgi:hypothetical protein